VTGWLGTNRSGAVIVLLGGVAVLSSYARSLAIDSITQAGLWGGVPSVLLPG